MLRRLRKHHFFMIDYGRAILRSLARPIFVWLVFATTNFVLVSSGLLWWTEHEANPRIEGYFDALYLCVTTITSVGYGDVVPMTPAGRVVAMVTMLGGTGLWVAYTAFLASSIVEIDLGATDAESESDGGPAASGDPH